VRAGNGMLLLPIRSLARQTGQSCNEDKA